MPTHSPASCETDQPGARPCIDARAVSEAGRIRLSLCGRHWTLHRPNDLESLWESLGDEDFGDDERLPYWVELWPASLALALWLQEHAGRITGRTCLDLGCGLGFTALVGASLGAMVLGVDYERQALAYAARNALTNASGASGRESMRPSWAVMDWRQPALRSGSCDVIWGGDVMYENRFVAPVFACIDHALAADGVVWIAEPGRDAYENFTRALLRGGWRSRCVAREKVAPLHVQETPVSVALWELSRR